MLLALASAPASAQRCPATPPPRTKGPLVWMNMDQHELDEAYDQSVYAFNQRFVQERRDERNEVDGQGPRQAGSRRLRLGR